MTFMAAYFDRFHWAIGRIVPDFALLKVRPRKTDPRAAASIVIAGMTLGLSLVVASSLAAPVRPAASPKSAGQVAPPPAAEKVTIVAATPRLDVPCAEQTWPYIDRRCLTESTQKRSEPEARTREAAPAAPPIDVRNVAAPVIPAAAPAAPVASETQGTAPREMAIMPDAAHLPQRRAANADIEATQDELDEADSLPVMSPRELRRLERRLERRRLADQGRRHMRQWRVTIFPRIF